MSNKPCPVPERRPDSAHSVLSSLRFEIDGALESTAQHMEGELLTIIDAAVPPGPQNKCLKNLVSNSLHSHVVSVEEAIGNACASLAQHIGDMDYPQPLHGLKYFWPPFPAER